MSKEVQTSGALPSFIVDRQARYERPGGRVTLGDYIDDIDFDYAKLRQVCQDFGFSEQDIENLTIRVSDNPSAHSSETAEYRYPTSTIWLYPWRQHAYRTSEGVTELYVRIEDDEHLSQDLGRQVVLMAYDKGYYESSEVGKIKSWGLVRNALGYVAMTGLTINGAYVAAVGMRAGPSPPTPMMLVVGVVTGMWLGGVDLLRRRRLHDAERVRAQVAYEVQRISHRSFENMVHIEPKG